jgi:hypothetical protein
MTNEPMKFSTIVSADDIFILTEDRIEAVEAMIETTKVVLLLLDSWTTIKIILDLGSSFKILTRNNDRTNKRYFTKKRASTRA